MHVVRHRLRQVEINSGLDFQSCHRHKKGMYDVYFSFKYYRASQSICRNLWQGATGALLSNAILRKLYGLECQLKSRQLLAATPLSGETNESPGLLRFDIKWAPFFCPEIRSIWFLESQVDPFLGPRTSKLGQFWKGRATLKMNNTFQVTGGL